MEEIFIKVRDVVISRTGISFADMVWSDKEEHVDARSLLVSLLHDHDMSDVVIARYLGMTRQGVNKLRRNFESRKGDSWLLSTVWKRCRDDLSTINS